MEYKLLTKQEMRENCISETKRIIHSLTSVIYVNGVKFEPMTQMQIASILHLTQCQMSRISTGVCVPSAPVFYQLKQIYKYRLANAV